MKTVTVLENSPVVHHTLNSKETGLELFNSKTKYLARTVCILEIICYSAGDLPFGQLFSGWTVAPLGPSRVLSNSSSNRLFGGGWPRILEYRITVCQPFVVNSFVCTREFRKSNNQAFELISK